MTAQEIVEEARLLAEDPDNKRWASREEMLCLINAGARVINDSEIEGGKYVIEAIYDSIHFAHVSIYPLIPPPPAGTTIH